MVHKKAMTSKAKQDIVKLLRENSGNYENLEQI